MVVDVAATSVSSSSRLNSEGLRIGARFQLDGFALRLCGGFNAELRALCL